MALGFPAEFGEFTFEVFEALAVGVGLGRAGAKIGEGFYMGESFVARKLGNGFDSEGFSLARGNRGLVLLRTGRKEEKSCKEREKVLDHAG